MATTNAKPARRRRPKPGDIAALRRVLWEVLNRAEALVIDPDADDDTVLKAVSAVSTCAGVYLRALDQHDIVARLEALEARVNGGRA